MKEVDLLSYKLFKYAIRHAHSYHTLIILLDTHVGHIEEEGEGQTNKHNHFIMNQFLY